VGDKQRIGQLDKLLKTYSTDSRLWFLKGSLLAGQGEYAPARAAMRKALDLSPHFSIARFQLGLLQLTSGEPIAAQETWGPLHGLPKTHFLRLFVEGMGHLIRDEFADAVMSIEKGIGNNSENLPLNHDMQLVVDAIRKMMGGDRPTDRGQSSVDMILQQAALKTRLH
jgi:tetratricopeptide (TPR) repeat protein